MTEQRVAPVEQVGGAHNENKVEISPNERFLFSQCCWWAAALLPVKQLYDPNR